MTASEKINKHFGKTFSLEINGLRFIKTFNSEWFCINKRYTVLKTIPNVINIVSSFEMHRMFTVSANSYAGVIKQDFVEKLQLT
jgi:hypothetical protein